MATKKETGTKTRRRGRPPASNAAETRERVLLAAQRTFAGLGYEATTNKAIADEAGITTGAIYHYFDSKSELYAAVLDHVSTVIYDRFRAAVDQAGDDLRVQIHAVLEAAAELEEADPSYAAFVVGVPTEGQRHPEIAELAAVQSASSIDFWSELIESHGDSIDPTHREILISTLRMTSGGLARYATFVPIEDYRRSVEGFRRLIDGTFFS